MPAETLAARLLAELSATLFMAYASTGLYEHQDAESAGDEH